MGPIRIPPIRLFYNFAVGNRLAWQAPSTSDCLDMQSGLCYNEDSGGNPIPTGNDRRMELYMGKHGNSDTSDGRTALDLRKEAYRLFGDMRSSTDEERHAYEEMLRRLSTPLPLKGMFSDEFGENDRPVNVTGIIDTVIEGNDIPRDSCDDDS